MDFEKFSDRLKGFVQSAQTLAIREGNPQITPEHLLKVLLDDDQGMAASLIARERPDVMHCVNTFPLISPAAYYAARDAGVGVVQSLHNYRLLCPNGLLLRDGHSCEDCVRTWMPWPAVVLGWKLTWPV